MIIQTKVDIANILADQPPPTNPESCAAMLDSSKPISEIAGPIIVGGKRVSIIRFVLSYRYSHPKSISNMPAVI